MTAPHFTLADEHFMRRALQLARQGAGQVAPNPLVGAVVVRDGQVVGEGYHQRFGGAHAEPIALGAAGERARGATVYVTLEPCAHHGKTPPCADALVAAGVTRVVVAVRDPNPAAQGGIARLAAAGIAVDTGLLHEEAHELNAAFLESFSTDRPWVTLKLAVSIDGAIAVPGAAPRWLTGPASRTAVHQMRAASDAIAVGIGTVLADDPALTVRNAPAPRVAPTRVVFDRLARLPLDSVLARTARATPTLVVVSSRAPVDRVAALDDAGVQVAHADALSDALAALRGRGIASLLVEGGAQLAAALLRERLVDRLVIFQAPIVLGTGALGAFSAVEPEVATALGPLTLVSAERHGDDAMTTYSLR